MYRKIITGFWSDSTVEELSSDGKLVLLYLLTAPIGTITGCFEVTAKRIAKETDLQRDAVVAALAEICDTNIAQFSEATSEILIRNWPKYNWTKSTSLLKPITEGIETVKDPNFKAQLKATIEDWFGIPYEHCLDTVSPQCMDIGTTSSVSVSVTDSGNGNGKERQETTSQVVTGKRKHGEFGNVLLTDEELDKLKERFPNDWKRRIDDLSYYIGSTGKRYKSHYRTLLSWDRRDSRKGAVADAGKYSEYDR